MTRSLRLASTGDSTSVVTRSSSRSNGPPSATSRRPRSVSRTPRPWRSSTGASRVRSSFLICWETAEAVKPSASAAAITEPYRSMVTSERSA